MARLIAQQAVACVSFAAGLRIFGSDSAFGPPIASPSSALLRLLRDDDKLQRHRALTGPRRMTAAAEPGCATAAGGAKMNSQRSTSSRRPSRSSSLFFQSSSKQHLTHAGDDQNYPDQNYPTVNKKGCYRLTNATDVVFTVEGGVKSPAECAAACEAARNLPSYAVLINGGKKCQCAHELEWSDIGWSEKCDLSCPSGAECGGSAIEAAKDAANDEPSGDRPLLQKPAPAGYATVYWWHRCPDDDPMNNRCKCPHGNAPEGADCFEDGALSCLGCDRGFELNGETCEPVECVCKSGVASEQMDCPKHGLNHCSACFEDEGYHLNGTTHTCEVNVCKCDGGVGATGSDCPRHDEDEKCAACHEGAGFVMDPTVADPSVNGTCIERQCTCENGEGAVGAQCPTHGGEFCASCDENDGFTLDGDECIPRECRCAHGTAPVGKQCPKNKFESETAEHCESCFSERGYHLEEATDVCELNRCTCENGTPGEGLTCAKHGTAFCVSCAEEKGYELVEGNKCALRQCLCGNGTAAVGETCPVTNTTMCTECKEGFDLTPDGDCVLRACECDLGEAALGQDCPKMGDDKCMKCTKPGFHLTENFKCELNECTCTKGKAATGALCPAHGTPKCTECHPGHTMMEDDRCVENQCTCEHGEGAANVACAKHESALCAKCDAGYELEEGACVERVCTCENGAPKRLTECPKAAFEAKTEVCKSCHAAAGYHLVRDGDKCELRQCTCANGVGEVGVACPADGDEVCESCDEANGYILNNATKLCELKQCVCTFGTGARGTACPANGTEMCSACDAGSDFMFGMGPPGHCVQNECWCKGGTGAVGKSCPRFDEHFCESCDEDAGFYKTAQSKCETRKCTCANGQGATAEQCPVHNSPKCDSCDAGYRLDKKENTCVPKECLCENGKGSVGMACPRHGDEVCASCDLGFHIDRDSCVENECDCAHGKGPKGAQCPEDGANVCIPGSCSPGYHFEDPGKCLKNECTCPAHGDPAKGAMCEEHQAQACAPQCDYGWARDEETKLCNKFVPHYMGCFEDTGERDLPARVGPWRGKKKHKKFPRATPESCNLWCRNYEFFGVQAGGECWCGNAIDFEWKEKHECNRCEGEDSDSLYCGAGWRNSIYTHQADVSFVGCYESADDSGFTLHRDGEFTFADCLAKCGDTAYFALTDGKACACGNALPGEGKKVGEDECMESSCLPADRFTSSTPDEWMCGGSKALSVYKSELSGTKSVIVDGVAYAYGSAKVARAAGSGDNNPCEQAAGFSAQLQGGRDPEKKPTLAIVESKRQERFLRMLMGKGEGFFVGPHDKWTEGAWMTADTNQLLKKKHKANWNGGEPNNWGNNEDCTVIRADGTWNDDACEKVMTGDRFFACSKRLR